MLALDLQHIYHDASGTKIPMRPMKSVRPAIPSDSSTSANGGLIVNYNLEVEQSKDIPDELLEQYISLAIRQVITEKLDDGTWFAELPGFPGVWSNADSQENAIEALGDILEEWLILKIEDEDKDIPVIDQFDLNVL